MSAVFNWLASAAWSTASQAARSLADMKALPRTRLHCRVVSVGNIQAGGAGKTPLVARIANEAVQRGKNVCILCRGYAGGWERKGGVISPDSPAQDAFKSGDEAALLHDLAPKAWIGVGADRVRQFGQVCAASEKAIELVILDDGFQHWRIEKDLEIVAMTSAERADILFRDWPDALWFADLIVWTKGTKRPDSGGKPIVKVKYRLSPPNAGPEAKFILVTGLADGNAALESARVAGYQVVRHLSFSDHARYSRGRVQSILDEARTAGCKVVVTGKDWVKWRGLGVDSGAVSVLEPEIVFEEGEEVWNRSLWGG